jgi:proteasome lid subunit RPN8/RPN11
MIHIPRKLVDQVIEHSKREVPNEACGILAGRNKRVERVFEMTNVEKSPVSFFMDGKEQLKVMKEIRNLGLEMAGIYHSHPSSPAYPSVHDVELAFYAEISYVIVSLLEDTNPLIRAFKIIDGKITEEELKIE